MDGIEIKEGNMLGLIEGKINKVGDDYFTVAEGILESMVDEDSELITIFYGKDVDENKIEEFTEKLEEKYEDCDIDLRLYGWHEGKHYGVQDKRGVVKEFLPFAKFISFQPIKLYL